MSLSPNTAPSAPARVRPFYWSVRRELWEHRSLYIAPLVTAGVVLLGALLSTSGLHHFHRQMASMSAENHEQMALAAYGFAAMTIVVTGLIVGVLYCLGALHNERRDRTILFWKSLPVSDLVTVLSKASIPLVVLPVVLLVITVALQLCMLAIGAMADAGATASVTFPPLLWMLQTLLYSVVAAALWYAPIVGWLLLVSAWARRVPFLWAFLPPLAVMVLEKVAFDTGRFAAFLGYRLDAGRAAFSPVPSVQGGMGLPQPDLARFLANPDLWLGLAATAALLAAAVWVRRYREPI